MPSSLLNLYTLFHDRDQNAKFLHRVQAAIYETAVSVRRETAPDPVTADFTARQEWARGVLNNPQGEALRMLPGLLVEANNAGLDLSQINTVTDSQIRSAVASLIAVYQ